MPAPPPTPPEPPPPALERSSGVHACAVSWLLCPLARPGRRGAWLGTVAGGGSEPAPEPRGKLSLAPATFQLFTSQLLLISFLQSPQQQFSHVSTRASALGGRGEGDECRNHLELFKGRGFSAAGAKSCGLEGVWGLGRGAGRQGLDGLSTARTLWPHWGGWEGLVFTVRTLQTLSAFPGGL